MCANALGYVHVIYRYRLANKNGLKTKVQRRKKKRYVPILIKAHHTNRTSALPVTLVSLDYEMNRTSNPVRNYTIARQLDCEKIGRTDERVRI